MEKIKDFDLMKNRGKVKCYDVLNVEEEK